LIGLLLPSVLWGRGEPEIEPFYGPSSPILVIKVICGDPDRITADDTYRQ
jgi:hypothetical protein